MNTALTITSSFNDLSAQELKDILSHLSSHHICENMHLRDFRIVKGKRELRFLHMVKLINPYRLDGHIGGPDSLELDYTIEFNGPKPQITINHYAGDEKDLKRIAQKLRTWLMRRMLSELQANDKPRSNYKKGQFYLRRKVGGIPFNHPHIQKGLKLRVFPQRFASKIGPWGFEIVHP